MIHGRQRQVAAPNWNAKLPQQGKRLWRGDLMNQVQVDVQHSRSIAGLRRLQHALARLSQTVLMPSNGRPGQTCRVVRIAVATNTSAQDPILTSRQARAASLDDIEACALTAIDVPYNRL